ncbi:MAG: hypothetical protein E6K53_09280 [Gammaproteobacteria bacterium]|nr:MAG: hypothetical protein E6K53_09280 [Gammaproteobacteria bacterium]
MKHLTRTIVATLGMTLAGSACALDRYTYVTERDDGAYFDYAHVARVDRVVGVMQEPRTREECWNEPHREYHPSTTYRREELPASIVTTVDGRDTLVRSQVVENGGYYTTGYEEKCRTLTDYDPQQRTISYDVVYTYHGQDYHDRMSHDPGTQVRIRVDHGYVELAE